MGLETGTYIDSLVGTNPLGTDAKSAGDDHIRLLKNTIKNTFPNVAGAVTPTHTELNFVDGVTSSIQSQLDGKQSSGSYQPSNATLTAISSGDVTCAWPVGSIYINASDATNPSVLLGGGTWTLFGSGRTLVCIDPAQPEFDTLGELGGAKTHTLTTAEMPAHTHNAGATTSYNIVGGPEPVTTAGGSNATSSTGGGGAHNNLQPYIVVYFWKRTA